MLYMYCTGFEDRLRVQHILAGKGIGKKHTMSWRMSEHELHNRVGKRGSSHEAHRRCSQSYIAGLKGVAATDCFQLQLQKADM